VLPDAFADVGNNFRLVLLLVGECLGSDEKERSCTLTISKDDQIHICDPREGQRRMYCLE
jgi:hypothetical protein